MSPSSPAPNLRSVGPDERNAPANVEAERWCIGAVMFREAMLPDLEELQPDDFFWPAHREIWLSMLGLHGTGRKVDLLAVTDDLRARGMLARLEGESAYLIRCISEIPHMENAGYYAGIVRAKSTRRRVILLCADISSKAYGGAGDEDELLADARNGLAALENVGTGQGPVRIGLELQNVLETIEARARDPERHAVMTGISRFDTRIGGLKPERLITVAAPPGLGKSAWAGTVACYNALRGVPSLIISLEMSRQELIERFLAGEAQVSTKEIGTGEVARPENAINMRQVFEAARRFQDVPLWIDDRDSLTTGQVTGTIRRWYARHLGAVPSKEKQEPPRPAFVAVDYLQLIADDDSESENRNLAVAKMTRALKRLAKSLRIPLVILSQLSRKWATRGGKPLLSDLRDSGAIEQDSDQVIFPWREPVKDTDGREDRNLSGPAEWLVAKNRGGPTGSIAVYWAAQYTRFHNLDDSGRYA
jgi:replicative DNA helicase